MAARTDRPSTLYSNPGQSGPRRSIPYGDNLRADEYDFIIFTGFDTNEFEPGGAASETTRRLIDEFKQDRKLVTAICRGQRVLALHGELDGKTVAICEYAKAAYDSSTRPGSNVEADGQVVTAARDQDAWDFVAKIIRTLDAR